MAAIDRLMEAMTAVRRWQIPDRLPRGDFGQIVLLGNGPSLSDAPLSVMQRRTTMCCNNFPASGFFHHVKPRFWVAIDPELTDEAAPDRHPDTFAGIRSADWPLTCIVPHGTKADLSGLDVRRFNLSPYSGPGRHLAWDRNLACPPSNNVMVAMIYLAISMGYRLINLLGAGHRWFKDVDVRHDNQVVVRVPHFYGNTEVEVRHRLHEELLACARSFWAYHLLREYADQRVTKVINCTPGSLIDAFERGELG